MLARPAARVGAQRWGVISANISHLSLVDYLTLSTLRITRKIPRTHILQEIVALISWSVGDSDRIKSVSHFKRNIRKKPLKA